MNEIPDLQQYKIPEGWEWELGEKALVLELFPTPEEKQKVRRPIVRVEWKEKPRSFSWHDDEANAEEKSFETIHEAIQYVVTLVGLGMYTL